VASLIGKALRNQAPPVPMGGGSPWLLPSGAGNRDQAYMQAFGNSGTVYANVSLLARATAKPPWAMYRTQTDGRVRYTTSDQGSDQRVEVVKHAALSLLNRPNPFWSRFRLFELSQVYLELCGESFWVVERDPRTGIPLSMWSVRPDRMEPVPDPDTYLAGWLYTAPDGRERIPLSVDEVIHVCYPNPLDPYRGLGPIQSVLIDIDAARYASEWNRNFFVNSARPDGVLQVDHGLEDTEREELMNGWREAHRGVGRAHRVAVLEAGVTWVPFVANAKDMDFVNLRTMSGDLIREAMAQHKIMTGLTDDVNRANAQTGEEIFASWQVAPRLDRWKDALNGQYLAMFGSTAAGNEVDYSYPTPVNREQDALELTAKSTAASVLVDAGYDQADVLTAVGLPEMGIAEEPTQQPALPPGWVAPPPAAPPAAARRRIALNGLPPQLQAGKDAAAKVYEQQAADYPPSAMAWMHHATWKGPVKVPLDHIEPDMQYLDAADPNHVADFVAEIRAGKKLKPVLLVKTPSDPQLKLIDGHHRYLADEQMALPVRAWIGTTATDHGDWETMHEHQFHPSAAAAGGDGPAARAVLDVAVARAGLDAPWRQLAAQRHAALNRAGAR
jgi:HK97 family phage portal protein